MLRLRRVTKVKVFFLVFLVSSSSAFLILANLNLFEFSAAILEKGLFGATEDKSSGREDCFFCSTICSVFCMFWDKGKWKDKESIVGFLNCVSMHNFKKWWFLLQLDRLYLTGNCHDVFAKSVIHLRLKAISWSTSTLQQHLCKISMIFKPNLNVWNCFEKLTSWRLLKILFQSVPSSPS